MRGREIVTVQWQKSGDFADTNVSNLFPAASRQRSSVYLLRAILFHFFLFGYLLGQYTRNMRQKQWISANWLHIVRAARPLLSNGYQQLCSNDWISLNSILFSSEWLVHNVSCSKGAQWRCWPVENLIKLKIGKRRPSSKANNNREKKNLLSTCSLRSRVNLKCNWWSLLRNVQSSTSIALSLFLLKFSPSVFHRAL